MHFLCLDHWQKEERAKYLIQPFPFNTLLSQDNLLWSYHLSSAGNPCYDLFIIVWSCFQITVHSNHAIALILVKLVSSLALKGMVIITQQIRGNQGIAVGFTSKSNRQVTSSVVLVLVCVQPSRFQSNWCDWCYFAQHWFVKISKLLCDYLCNCFGFGFVTAIWKLLYISIPIQGYTIYPC